MSTNWDSQTPVTLLARLQQNSQDTVAWNEFVARYQPKILAWCTAWGLQPADAEDVTQNVLLKLVSTMRTFQYDPARSFRAWLRTVTQHAWSDFTEGLRRVETARVPDVGVLATAEARSDLAQRLAEEFDHELMDLALKSVHDRVSAHTWEAFRLTTLEGLAGAEVAARLGQPVAHVFVAKHRVQKMLQEEIRRLEGGKPE
ncbi:MAG: sigma-70 family RNA polymerase sigma factor [Gemmataceae bacterium]